MSQEEEDISDSVKELDDEDFKDEKDWDFIRPLNLYIDLEANDEDIFSIYYYDDKEKTYEVCSEINDDTMEDGVIADIADVMFPVMYDIKHTREVVPVKANFLVGFWGAQRRENEDTFYFPLFWNGTINVGKREVVEIYGRLTTLQPEVEKINTDLDLTKPVGYFITELDMGGNDVNIEDYSLEDREHLVRQFVNEGNYKIKYHKGKDVSKEIDDNFLKKQEKIILEGVVQVSTKSYKQELKSDLSRLIDKYNEIKSYDTANAFLDSLDNFTEKYKDSLVDNDVGKLDKQRAKYKEILSKVDEIKAAYKPKATASSPKATSSKPKAEKKEKEKIKKSEEEKKVEEPASSQKATASLSKREEMENMIRQVGELYSKLKREYEENKSPEKLKEAQKAKKILQKKKEEYIEFVNALTESPKLAEPSGVAGAYIPNQSKDKEKSKKDFEAFVREREKKAEEYRLQKAGTGVVVSLGQPANKISKEDEIWKWSNPKKVQVLAKKYLGKDAVVYRSTKKDKKYMINNPHTGKMVHFGQLGYEDFTKHYDEKRRQNYLTRTANMRGNWKDDMYSANNLSRNILW